jgi:hypothetical protein
MAKQAGIAPFRGRIDNFTFRETEDGFTVGRRTGVDKQRILTDPVFERTRASGRDFGSAAKAGQFLLSTCREVVLHKPDSKIMSRLNKVMAAVVGSDQSNVKGERKAWLGDLSLLRNFEFNRKSNVNSAFYGSYTPTIDRVAGTCKVLIPAFVPKVMVNVPSGATHFRFVAGGIELDFAGETFVRDKAVSAYIPWDKNATGPITLTCDVTPASTLPLFLVFGIEYATQQYGVTYEHEGGLLNGAVILQVDA